MIDRMLRNLISREANVVLKIHKTLLRLHIEYCSQARAPVSRHGNWSVILKLEERRGNNDEKKKKKITVIGRDKRNCFKNI